MAFAAKLGNLNPELLAIILQYVVDSSTRPFPNLNLVSHHFNSITQTLIRRKIYLDFDHDNLSATNEKIETLLSEDLKLANIRHLTLHGQPGNIVSNPSREQLRYREVLGATENYRVRKRVRRKAYDRYGIVWRRLENLITKVYKLETIHWSVNEPMPKAILQAITASHPTASLGISDWSRDGDNVAHDDEDELALIRCPNLHSIQASFPLRDALTNGRKVRYDYREIAFWRIVSSAPNLRHASVSRRAKYEPILDPNYLRVDDSQARLFEGTSPSKSNPLQSVTLDGYGHGVLHQLERYIDLSLLRSLKYTRGWPNVLFFETAKLKLTNLKHLSLNFTLMPRPIPPDLEDAATSFLRSCDQLESLSLWSATDMLLLFPNNSSIVNPKLTSLQLHEREGPARRFITCDHLESILKCSPSLSDLTIDINLGCGLDWHTSKYCKLMSLHQPRLHKVQIYTNERNRPSLNQTLQLFHQIYMQIFFSVPSHDSRTLLPSTIQLDIKFGEWESKAHWRMNQDTRYYKVRPAERDEDNRRGDIRVEAERYVYNGRGVRTEREVVCEFYPTQWTGV